MTEAVDATDAELTPEQAAETIEEARGYEKPLRRRAEGVTWMIWGLVAAGIQLSFSAGNDLFRPYRSPRIEWGTPGWYEPVVILGWMAAGMALTFAAWRIASLTAPRLAPKPLRAAIGGLLFLALLYGVIAVLFWLAGGLPEALYPLLAIGAAWLGVGALDLFETTATGRRTLLAIGGLILAVGVAATIGLPWSGFIEHSDRLTYDATAPFVILAGGGIPFLAGLWQSWTG